MKPGIPASRRRRLARQRRHQQPPPPKRPLWSFREGGNEFRWLPDATGRLYEEVLHHFGVGPFERGLVCGGYANLACYPCESITSLRQSTSLRDRQLAQRMQPVMRIFINVVDLQRLGDGVKVLGMSQALLDEIRLSLWDLTLEELTHPERGHTIRVRKVVDGAKIRYPDIRISATPTPIPDGQWRTQVERLDEYFRVLTYGQQQAVVAGRLDPRDVTGLTYAS
jgi:hypothetical protein